MADHYLTASPRSAAGGTFSATMWLLGSIAMVQILAVAWAVVTRPGLKPSESPEGTPVAATDPPATENSELDPSSQSVSAITDPQEIFTNPAKTPTSPPLAKPDIAAALADPTLPAPGDTGQMPAGVPNAMEWGNLLPKAGIAGPDNLGGIAGAQPLSESLNQAALQNNPAHEITEPAILKLIADGSELQSAGDMNGAIKAYRRASEILPNHPRILSEMAGAYSQLGRADKATEIWERIYRLGAADAGGYFSIADQQLRGQGIELADLGANSNILKITSIVPSKDPASTDGERVNLRVTVGADPATRPAGPDMKMHVYFYDEVDGEDFDPSTANTDEDYPTEPYDWSSGMEVIDVTYHQPIFTDEQQRELGKRSYYGYIIELYYRDELQDRVASPEALSEIVPGEKTERPQPVIGPDSALFPQGPAPAE